MCDGMLPAMRRIVVVISSEARFQVEDQARLKIGAWGMSGIKLRGA